MIQRVPIRPSRRPGIPVPTIELERTPLVVARGASWVTVGMPLRIRVVRVSRERAWRALLAALVLLGVCGTTVLMVYGAPYEFSAAGLVATLTALPCARLVEMLRYRHKTVSRVPGRLVAR